MAAEATSLLGVRIAVPETRQQDTLLRMLKRRGAAVLPLPLVAIHDHPDQAALQHWLAAFLASPPDLFILLTGEGLRRLLAMAGRAGLGEDFVATLGRVPTLCRGPKPERELRELGLAATWQAAQPTTAGVITTLEGMALAGQRISVQLYGEEPNLPLRDYLAARGAEVDCVAPYVYASQEEEVRVVDFIDSLSRGEVDVLAFTSQGQYQRLANVARKHGREVALRAGMQRVVLAAVGPVVRDQLEEAGYAVAIMPERVYFMLPLVAAIARHFDEQTRKHEQT